MAQPINKNKIKNIKNNPPSKKKKVKKQLSVSEIIKRNIERSKKPHPQYGTSKLEEKFAHEFLDKLGVKYQYQFEAKDIKRFYDFYLPDSRILIECDGDYYHGKDLLHEEKSAMQKKNEYVDKIKDEWAYSHSIPLIRIWESDINKNPKKVMEMLKEKLYIAGKKEEKNKRH